MPYSKGKGYQKGKWVVMDNTKIVEKSFKADQNVVHVYKTSSSTRNSTFISIPGMYCIHGGK